MGGWKLEEVGRHFCYFMCCEWEDSLICGRLKTRPWYINTEVDWPVLRTQENDIMRNNL